MTISQEKVGKLLARSSSPEETEEVLLAYCFRSVSSPLPSLIDCGVPLLFSTLRLTSFLSPAVNG